jgi:hypothetical protein
VRRKRHGNRSQTEFASSVYDSSENLAMTEMQAVEVADADDGRLLRDISIRQ